MVEYDYREYAEIGLDLNILVGICNVELLALQTVVIKIFSNDLCALG